MVNQNKERVGMIAFQCAVHFTLVVVSVFFMVESLKERDEGQFLHALIANLINSYFFFEAINKF
jgi:hypothetical protein